MTFTRTEKREAVLDLLRAMTHIRAEAASRGKPVPARAEKTIEIMFAIAEDYRDDLFGEATP